MQYRINCWHSLRGWERDVALTPAIHCPTTSNRPILPRERNPTNLVETPGDLFRGVGYTERDVGLSIETRVLGGLSLELRADNAEPAPGRWQRSRPARAATGAHLRRSQRLFDRARRRHASDASSRRDSSRRPRNVRPTQPGAHPGHQQNRARERWRRTPWSRVSDASRRT